MKVQNGIDFMDGQLTLMFMPENNITLGTLEVFIDDCLVKFYAVAKCLEEDTFSEDIGGNIVKLKLQRKYYTYKKSIISKKKRKLEMKIKALDNVDYNKKIKGVNSRLAYYSDQTVS